MADSKKYNGSTWQHSLRKLTTATDTITTLPVDIYADGNTAIIGISGNTVQTGTPSPDNPIKPQGTGERTGNLFDISTLENGIYLASNGNKYGGVSNGVRGKTKIKVLPNTAYTLSAQSSSKVSLRILEWSNGTFINQTPKYNISGSISLTVTTTAETTEIAFNIESENGQYATNIMLNTGSQPLPYELYGYKIPILNNSQTTNVYLGEVQSTRRIKKLVLTGEETFTQISDYQQSSRFRLKINDMQRSEEPYSIDTIISSHYVPATGFAAGTIVQSNDTDINLTFNMQSPTYPDLTTFTNWLSQQYANGTPVTVWYVLAEPETAVINEPIRKIGDYADTVSGITIPTISGKDTFDVQTTLKPSEVSLAYTGWHDAEVKEWDGSQWD